MMDTQDLIFAIADKITKHNFEIIWAMERGPMMGLTKEEIAEEMFFKGIAYILDHLTTLDEINLEQAKRKLEANIRLANSP